MTAQEKASVLAETLPWLERFRGATASTSKGDAMIRVLAPAAPDAGHVAALTSLPEDRAVRNAAAFDRLWERLARTYFSSADATARRVQWDAVRATQRPRALAAANDIDFGNRAARGSVGNGLFGINRP